MLVGKIYFPLILNNAFAPPIIPLHTIYLIKSIFIKIASAFLYSL